MRYRAIARRLQVSWLTVERYAASDTFPEFAPRHAVPSLLDPYLRYLHQQWAQDETNASQLWREITAQGYRGGYRQVARWAQQQRLAAAIAPTPPRRGATKRRATAPPAPASTARLPSARQLAWFLIADPDDLQAEEQATLHHLQQDADTALAHGIVQRFQQMVRTRQIVLLDAWLEAAQTSGIPELHPFAKGLQQDDAAVRAALEHVASNGQTDGQVNRLKLMKRQGYGRANFDLLRKRVLATAY